jgi:uncharacterized protein YbjT (DUF2867 family)
MNLSPNSPISSQAPSTSAEFESTKIATDMPSTTILLTLANGKQCRHLIPALLARPETTVRAFVHSKESGDNLLTTFRNPPNLEIYIGDLLNPSDITYAVKNVQTVFHVGPPMSIHESHIGTLVIQAAQKGGVTHFIYSSVLHPIRSKLLNHDVKRLVEEYLIESGLNWTILQPAHFLQNTNLVEAVKTRVLSVPYNPANEMGFLDLRDMAKVVGVILDRPEKHYLARYELCGMNISYLAYGRLMSEYSGKEVQIKKSDPREVAKAAAKGNVDFEDRLARMFFYYDRWGLVGNSNILEWLLGGEVGTPDEYIKDALAGKL